MHGRTEEKHARIAGPPLGRFCCASGTAAGASGDWLGGSSTVFPSYLRPGPRQHSNYHPMLLVLAHWVAACTMGLMRCLMPIRPGRALHRVRPQL